MLLPIDNKQSLFRSMQRSGAPDIAIAEFEGVPGHVLLGIVTFEELDGKTKLMTKSVFEIVEDRDGMLKAGIEEGGPETMDHLAELVEKLESS